MIAALVLSALTATASVHHPVTSAVPAAQASFDRGLLLYYAFNGDEAYGVFASALEADPHLAMAAWGEALAAGSDLNTGITPERFARAHDAAVRAESLEMFASPEERAYIDAMAARYAGTWEDRAGDGDRYRAAMAQLVMQYPSDDDALMLDAEALMEAKLDDADARDLIRRVLARNPSHVMANHLCIHSYDYAADHAPALACADRIASWQLGVDELHLAHMPAHTYIVLGDYRRALNVSERAWQLRERDSEEHKYAAHDAYTGWSVAMMLGDESSALEWAQRAGAAYDGSDLWATWTRFGDWGRISGTPPPREFYAPLALGLTDLHRGDAAGAQTMLARYRDTDADYRWLLEAAVDERDGQLDAARTAYARAIAYQTSEDVGEQLPLFPAGEYLGAMLYRHAHYTEAEQAYRDTLARYPRDPRALYGLAQTQRALGETQQAAQTLKTFAAVWNAPNPPEI